MSVEQINLRALQGLLPMIGFVAVLMIICVAVWFGTMALCALVEKVKNKIKIKGAR